MVLILLVPLSRLDPLFSGFTNYNIFNDVNLVQMFFLNTFFLDVDTKDVSHNCAFVQHGVVLQKWTAAPVFEADLSVKIINVHLVR